MTKAELITLAGGLPEVTVLHDSANGVVLEGMSESGQTAWYAFTAADCHATSRTDVEGVLLGRRPLRIMKGYTRIVGYYSEVGNWNRSKLAELKDRQAGTYALEEGAVALESHAMPQDVVEEQLTSNADAAVCTLAAD